MVDFVNDTRETGALLRDVARRHVRSQREHLACSGLASVVECHVLTELGRGGPVTSARLAAQLGLDKGQLSRALARMTRAGLLGRRAVPGDARAMLLVLSPAGSRRHRALERVFDAHAAGILARLTRAERGRVRDALALLRRAYSAPPRRTPARRRQGGST